jgi:hypothetical protein
MYVIKTLVSQTSGVLNSSSSSRLRDSFVFRSLLWGPHPVLNPAKGRDKMLVIFNTIIWSLTSEEVENR